MGPGEASDMIKIALLARAEGYNLYDRATEWGREGERCIPMIYKWTIY